MTGGGGNDTYIVDAAGDLVTGGAGIDTVRAAASFILGADVENLVLTGAGNLSATGNGLKNTLAGNDGNNTLAGGAESDFYIVTANGGADLVIDTAGSLDVITFGPGFDPEDLHYSRSVNGTGVDLIIAYGAGDEITAAGFFAAATDSIEEVRFTDNATVHNTAYIVQSVTTGLATPGNDMLTGTADANAISGFAGNDTLNGLGGDDTLDGGSGADTMSGGEGDDIFIVDSVTDVIVESLNEGTDEARAALSYTLAVNVENLSLMGSGAFAGTGNAADNFITGNSGKNALSGLDGADTLDGGGEADTMKGGQGNDTYIVDNARDKITETTQAGSGIDIIQASVTFKLVTGVENLLLTGIANIDGTGGTGINVLTGNQGDNTLSGLQGADTLIGNGGNDTFVVDDITDVVIGGAGTDHVLSAVGYTLGAELENLTLTGTAAFGGGNGLDNTLNGNGKANLLNGFAGSDSLVGSSGNDTLDGGAGADYLNGGTGNDLYILDNAGDIVIDATGTDTIHTAAFDVVLGVGLELLVFTGSLGLHGQGNAGNNIMFGNDGANSLTGFAGNDTISGGLGDDILAGGLGTDKLSGGGGADRFIFTSAAEGKDTITDFNLSEGDVLDLQELLTGWGGDIHNYLQVSQQGANTIIKVDTDGAVGGLRYVQVATLTACGLGATDEFDLILPGGGILV